MFIIVATTMTVTWLWRRRSPYFVLYCMSKTHKVFIRQHNCEHFLSPQHVHWRQADGKNGTWWMDLFKKLYYSVSHCLEQWFKNWFNLGHLIRTQYFLPRGHPYHNNFAFWLQKVYKIHDQNSHTFYHCVFYGWNYGENKLLFFLVSPSRTMGPLWKPLV